MGLEGFSLGGRSTGSGEESHSSDDSIFVWLKGTGPSRMPRMVGAWRNELSYRAKSHEEGRQSLRYAGSRFRKTEFLATPTAPVPSPVVGAGLPGLMLVAGGGVFGWGRRKRKIEGPS